MAKQRIAVVGGGLGGLWATLRIVENGFPVDLFSLFPVKRSHSCCAQGGINAALDVKGQGDSIWQHIVDTIKGGDYLSDQPPIKSLCEDAPGMIRAFDRMGVTFSRTPEGVMDQRLFGGVKNRRTCFAGATTGQQLLYAVDEQVRAWEAKGMVRKFEGWDFLSVVLDDERVCRGPHRHGPELNEDIVLPRRGGDPGNWRPGTHLRPLHNVEQLDWRPGFTCLPTRRPVCQRRVHSVPPNRHPRP